MPVVDRKHPVAEINKQLPVVLATEGANVKDISQVDMTVPEFLEPGRERVGQLLLGRRRAGE